MSLHQKQNLWDKFINLNKFTCGFWINSAVVVQFDSENDTNVMGVMFRSGNVVFRDFAQTKTERKKPTNF